MTYTFGLRVVTLNLSGGSQNLILTDRVAEQQEKLDTVHGIFDQRAGVKSGGPLAPAPAPLFTPSRDPPKLTTPGHVARGNDRNDEVPCICCCACCMCGHPSHLGFSFHAAVRHGRGYGGAPLEADQGRPLQKKRGMTPGHHGSQQVEARSVGLAHVRRPLV